MNSVTQTLRIPDQLFTRLTSSAILSFVVILASSAYGLHHLYEGYVIEAARNHAMRLGRAFQETRPELLTKLGLTSDRPVTQPALLAQLDAEFSTYLAPYNILKVKVFSANGRILYSSDHSIIGQQNLENRQLLDALHGSPYSKIQTKDQILDLSHETRFDVDVVETYIPVYDRQNAIIGAFEIYQDTTFEYSQVRQGVILSISALAVILAAVLFMSYCCIRRTAKALSHAQQELGTLACTDPVTGICNRREILHRSGTELERLRRGKEEENREGLCLLMIDVDHFKQINDTYGHPAGDEILRLVAERIRDTLRASSHVGRYGGEEFLAVIPDADLAEAETLSARILGAVSGAAFTVQHDEIHLTMSIGIASTASRTVSVEQLLQAADNNLYAAKLKGRNCYVGAVCSG